MNDLPILFMSKETEGREHIAERTINALRYHLKYNGNIKFYCTVYGSESYQEKLLYLLDGFPVEMSAGTTGTAGSNWNFEIQTIFKKHDMYFRFEDDFLLKDDLNINTYVELLETNQNVGMVRLGLMPINLKLYSVGWYDKMNQGHIFFDCLPSSPYAYSGNPGLVHKRLHEAVGYFHEEHNPGDIEIDFDSRVRDKMKEGGPRIWWPLDLGKFGCYGAFDHIGEVKSY